VTANTLKWKRFILEGQIIETIWTTPATILVLIEVPSLRLLYLIDEFHNPVLTLEAVGHQWYWSDEYFQLKMESATAVINSLPSAITENMQEYTNIQIPGCL